MKRSFDILLSLLLIVILSPLLLVVSLLVLCKLGSPVIFHQLRPGLNGKLFSIYKFRSMIEETKKPQSEQGDLNRLTEFGRVIRSWSLDELPQLFNVLKGDMSLVGPRPLLSEYLPLYSHEQLKRHDVRPGITGWSQINGRNNLTWQEKFKLDIWYVDNQSFYIDMKILYLTLLKVLRREGISSKEGCMPVPFTGNNE